MNQDTDITLLSVDDAWLREWAAEGIAGLERLLAAHAAFDEFLRHVTIHTMAIAPTRTDAALVRRLQGRDHAAWEELYAEYQPRLRAFGYRLTGNTHDADDLAQETFVRALPALDRLDPDTVDLTAYLFATTKNLFLKQVERAKRAEPTAEVPEPDIPAAIEDDPERSALLHRQQEEVRIANGRLDPRQRLVLALCELEDRSYAEIGELVGLNENAVAQLVFRARERLRTELRLVQVDPESLPEECRSFLPLLAQHLDGKLRGPKLETTLAHLEELRALPGGAHGHARGEAPLPRAAPAAARHARRGGAGGCRARPRAGRLLERRGAARLAAPAAAWHRRRGRGRRSGSPHPGGRARRGRAPGRAGQDERASIDAAGDGGGDERAGSDDDRRAAGSAAALDHEGRGQGDARRRSQSRPRSRRHRPRRSRRPTPSRTVSPPKPPPSPPPPPPPPARKRVPKVTLPPTVTGEEPVRGQSPDTTAPTVTIGQGPVAAGAATSATFAFTASEPRVTFTCRLDDGAWQPCTSPRALEAIPLGTHTFEVRGTDAAGNVGAPATRRWTVTPPPDTTPPTVTLTQTPPASTTSRSATFAFSASETGVTFACSYDSGPFASCTSPHTVSDVGADDHTFAVRATDAAGNTGESALARWTVVVPLPDLVAVLTDTTVTVRNAGEGPAGPSLVTVPGIGTFTIAALPPGQSATRTFTCLRGTHTATADYAKVVAESNEENNTDTRVASCLGLSG